MNKIYFAKSKDHVDDQWKIGFMNELIDVVHKTAECGLNPEEAKNLALKRLGTYYFFYVK